MGEPRRSFSLGVGACVRSYDDGGGHGKEEIETVAASSVPQFQGCESGGKRSDYQTRKA